MQVAKEKGLIKRERKIDPVQLFWVLVKCFSTHQAHELAGLHRSFIEHTGKKVSYSSFYERLNQESFVDFIQAVYQRYVSQLYVDQWGKMPTVFHAFTDVKLHDGSSWAINYLLSEVFPGRFTKNSPAAIELHATWSLRTGAYQKLEIAPDKQSEHDFIPEGEPDVLYLLDRGYVNLPKLNAIAAVGGFYLVRSKSNGNPLIKSVSGSHAHRQRYRLNKKLKDHALKKGLDYDFQVQMKAGDKQVYSLRLVMIWNPKTRKHLGFLTNLPPEKVSCQDIGKLYRLRWQIELSFKELKSYSALKRFQTSNEHVIKAFIWLSVLVMQLRRYLVFCAERLNPRQRLSTHKAAISASEFMLDFVKCMAAGGGNLKSVLLKIFFFLQATMGFSNLKRKNAFTQIELPESASALCLAS